MGKHELKRLHNIPHADQVGRFFRIGRIDRRLGVEGNELILFLSHCHALFLGEFIFVCFLRCSLFWIRQCFL